MCLHIWSKYSYTHTCCMSWQSSSKQSMGNSGTSFSWGNSKHMKQFPAFPTFQSHPQVAAACVVRQSGTNFRRICKAQTLGNSLSVVVSAGYSSVRMAGGASDRRWLKACRTNGLSYLLCTVRLKTLVTTQLILQPRSNRFDVFKGNLQLFTGYTNVNNKL